jgi:hypothetical protein
VSPAPTIFDATHQAATLRRLLSKGYRVSHWQGKVAVLYWPHSREGRIIEAAIAEARFPEARFPDFARRV